jgi:hypothetical protein
LPDPGLEFTSELEMVLFADHAINRIGLERFTKAENLANVYDSQRNPRTCRRYS